MRSFILIHPTVWPQWTMQHHRKDTTGRTDRQRSDSIGRTVLQMVSQRSLYNCISEDACRRKLSRDPNRPTKVHIANVHPICLQICHQLIGRKRVLSIDSVVTLAVCCVSNISLVLYPKCHFWTYPLVFHQKFGDVPIGLSQIDELCSAVSQVPGLIMCDVIFSEH